MEWIEIARAGGGPYEALIRRAVSDASVFEAMHRSLCLCFEVGGDEERVLAIEVGGHLGDRVFSSVVADHLGTALGEPMGLPSWSQPAVRLVSDLLMPTDPKRFEIFKACIARPETRLAGWQMSRQDDAAFVIPFIGDLLAEHPETAKAVAIKFALIWQGSCEALAPTVHNWTDVHDETIKTFMDTLEMYLLRVRRVRLWKTFKRLSELPT